VEWGARPWMGANTTQGNLACSTAADLHLLGDCGFFGWLT
jgi:hypothetical protein